MVDGTPPQADGPRLTLLQFVFFDDPWRLERTTQFPFFLGQARALGVSARWTMCGVYSYETSHQNAHLIHIDEEETALLVEHLVAATPTHLVFPDLLDDELEAALRAALPETAFVCLHDAGADFQTKPPADWLPGVLGLPSDPWEGRFLADAVTPAYESDLVPPPEGYDPPPKLLVPIVCGPTCLYKRPVQKNPYFADVPLRPVHDLDACSFCRRVGGFAYVFETPPFELALKQVIAAARTEGERHQENVFLLSGAAVALRIGRFMRTVLENELPPSQFWFQYRVDELLRVADDIEAVLPDAAAAGHRICLYNMGIENFSPVEQERYNKGFGADDVFASAERVRGWLDAWPDAFEFGNYGAVLFTPWTTLEDMAHNYAGLKRLRDMGFPLQERKLPSKLQLFREIALYELAVRDGVEILDLPWREGIVVDADNGFVWYNGHAKGGANAREWAWRFLDDATREFYEIVWRAALWQELDDEAKADPFFLEVRDLYESYPDRWQDTLDFLDECLGVAREAEEPLAAADIVARLKERLPAPTAVPARLAPPPRDPIPEPPIPDPRTPDERLLVDRSERIAFALGALADAPQSPLPGWRLASFDKVFDDDAIGYRASLVRDGERLGLTVLPADAPVGAFAAAGRVKLIHDPDTPLASDDLVRGVRRLAAILDHYLAMPARRSAS